MFKFYLIVAHLNNKNTDSVNNKTDLNWNWWTTQIILEEVYANALLSYQTRLDAWFLSGGW